MKGPPTFSVNNPFLKNKKLVHEYSLFEYKVSCFLLSTTNNGKTFFSTDFEPLDLKYPDREIKIYQSKLESLKIGPNRPEALTINRWHEFLLGFYTIYRIFHLGHEIEKPKKNILIRLREMFEDQNFDSSIIVFSGSMTQNGGLVIESENLGLEEISLIDILNEWNSKSSKQKHLLIILDCNYSGKWVQDFNNHKERIETVSILASCQEKQKSAASELGFAFTHNIMKFLTKNQYENMIPLDQTPCFAGDYLDCKKFTNLYFNFNSWDCLIAVQKSDYVMIEYDNGTYIGHTKLGIKQFWGNFLWKHGIFKNCQYIGEFHKGKLHGKGIMMYTGGRVYEGEFKNNSPDGLAVETYENGDKYIGKFFKGFKLGYGVYVYANGEIYEGEFANNKPCGQGRLLMPKNAFYEGSFKNGKCNGHGKYYYENGDVYEGKWVDSIKHGLGIYYHANGDIYEGDFVNGLRNGFGKLSLSSGQVIESNWINDVMSGEVRKYMPENQLIREWIKSKIPNTPVFAQVNGTQKVQTPSKFIN